MKNQDGFTLIEILTTMVVAIIVVSMGVPAFKSIIANNRATGQVNTLVTAFNLARNAAVTSGVTVMVCKLKADTDPMACEDDTDENDWSSGWLVFEDPDEDAVLDAGEEQIRVWAAPSGKPEIMAVDEDDDEVIFLSFDPQGVKIIQKSAELEITNEDCTGDQVRVVWVSVTGQITNTREACPVAE